MTVSMLRVSNLSNQEIYHASFTKEQKDQLGKLFRENKNPRGIFSHIIPILVPLRTDTLSNFAIDLFFPATYHAALKINDAVQFVFAFIATVFLDLFTLAIRIVTATPWLVLNPGKTENQLWKLLWDIAPNRPTQAAFEKEDAVQIRGNYQESDDQFDRIDIYGTAHFVDFFGGLKNDLHFIHVEQAPIQPSPDPA